MSSWTSHESNLTLSADFEFVEVSPGEPGSLASTEGQECHSRCRNERRLANGRARGVRMRARQVNTGQWIRGLLLVFHFIGGVKVTPGIDAVG